MNFKQIPIGEREIATQYHAHVAMRDLMVHGHTIAAYSDDKVVFFVIDQPGSPFQEMLSENNFVCALIATRPKDGGFMKDLPSLLDNFYPNRYAIYDKDVLREYLIENYDEKTK